MDPAIFSQSPPQQSPMDVVGQALAALAASGMDVGPPQPSLYGTGAHDTDLQDPSLPESPFHTAPSQPSGQYDTAGKQIHGRLLPPGSVTITGQQVEPTQAQANQRTRQDLLNDPSRPLQSDDVAGYEYREQSALGDAHAAQQRQAQAEVAAEQAAAERMALVHEQSAQDLETADALYQQRRAAIQHQTDVETAQWVQEYQTKATQEPNTDRWFESRTGVGKALWALGMVFGAVHAGLTPGAQNVALQMAMGEIQRDVQMQKDRIDREMGALRMKGTLMEKRQARNLTDASDDHSMLMGRLQSLKQAYLARAAAPGNEGLQAGLAAADAWFSQQELTLAGSKREAAVRVREGQLDRAHQTYLAKLTDKRTRDISAAEIAKDYDLATLAASKDLEKAKLAAKGDIQGVPSDLGAVMQGSPLGPTIQVHKESADKMRSVFAVANQRYDALAKVKKALEDGSFSSRMATGDVELRAATRYLGYATAKDMDPGGKLTDNDVKFATTMDFGYDPAGNLIEKSLFNLNLSDIKKHVDNEMRSMPEKVSNSASTYLDPNVVGEKARVLWSPQNLRVPESVPQSATQVFQGAGLMTPPTAPTSPEDFERRQVLENDPTGMFKGRQLPKYDTGKVAEFTTAAKGLQPEYVRKLAENTLKDLSDNTDPWAGPVDQGALTARQAIKAAEAKAVKEAEGLVKRLKSASSTVGWMEGIRGMPKPTAQDIAGMAQKDIGLTDAPDAVAEALKVAEEAYERAKKVRNMGRRD